MATRPVQFFRIDFVNESHLQIETHTHFGEVVLGRFNVSWNTPSGGHGSTKGMTAFETAHWAAALHTMFSSQGDEEFSIPEMLTLLRQVSQSQILTGGEI